jgi:hypothetical protein
VTALDITPQDLARILGGEVSGRGVVAPGEGHSKDDRSLSIKITKDNPDGFVVHSHSPKNDDLSSKDYVRERLRQAGYHTTNARAQSNGRTQPRTIVATYAYHNEADELLFQVVRYKTPDNPKNFIQRRPDGKSGWIYKLNDTRRVLYRLPELIEAVAQDRPIFVCEGEKAVDAAVKLGVPATCSPHGAGKWRDEYSPQLKGAIVVILPDNDEPGRKHVKQVAKALSGVAGSVKVLTLPGLPEGGDVYDWVQAGGTAEQLWQLVETKAVEWKLNAHKPEDWRAHTFTAAALRTMPFPEVSYVVPGIIPEGLTILAGRPKIGKSWAALDIAIGIASKRDVLGGLKVNQGDVLYLALEDNPRRLQRRMTKLISPFGGGWPDRLALTTKWNRLDKGGVDDIEAWCKSVPEPRLAILDTLAGVRPTRDNSQTLYDTDYKALLDVHRLANDRGMSAVALHHTRKMDADDPLDTVSGSLGLVGCADTCLILARSSKGTTLYVRGRDIEECERAIIFSNENCRWTLLGDATEVYRSDSRTKILEALAKASNLMGPAEIASVTGILRNTVDVTLHRMAADGEVIQVGRGRYAHPSKEFATPCQKRQV